MKSNFKKELVDPLYEDKIKLPTVKQTVYLKQSETYEDYLRLRDEQAKLLNRNIGECIATSVLSLVCVGLTAIKYYRTRKTNIEYRDNAELLVIEASADSELMK